jgi:hypothetical protein
MLITGGCAFARQKPALANAGGAVHEHDATGGKRFTFVPIG